MEPTRAANPGRFSRGESRLRGCGLCVTVSGMASHESYGDGLAGDPSMRCGLLVASGVWREAVGWRRRMRVWALLVALVAVFAAACAASDQGADPGTTAPPSTEAIAAVSSTTTTLAASSTTAAAAVSSTTTTVDGTTTSVLPEAVWTVGAYGRTPTVSLSTAGALGSGCAPGSDLLPDGIWFGWVDDLGPGHVEFDLACLWPGRLEPAVSNDTAKVRDVATSADTLVYLDSASPVSFGAWGAEIAEANNAPGLPDSRPFWIFVNSGVVTEMAQYPEAIDWMMQASAWPSLGPGCCEEGTVAPPSPTGPWPEEGWPADGFYSVVEDISHDEIEVTLRKWLSCSDYPDMCPAWWIGGEVTTHPDAPTLQRSIPFDRDLTVVILPIMSDTAIVGDGYALRALLDDLNAAAEAWLHNPAVSWDELTQLATDPEFPFGGPYDRGLAGGDELGYRGPGGVHLTPYTYSDQAHFPGWTALEIRSGRPILYIHAGIIAG